MRIGVIHRDLKPENILLHDGQPLVADFGIALAVSNAGGARITQTGISLGTPHYMSPEQATGDRGIDGRTDIYALAAVTFEMLGGEPPHNGSTAQAIIARLLTESPRALRTLRHTVPAHVDAAIHRALEKIPADRFTTAHEFADALQGRVSPVARAPVATLGNAARWKPIALAASAVATLALAAALWALSKQPDAAPPQRARFTLELPNEAKVNPTLVGRSMAFSPDGSTIVYVGGPQASLYLRRLDELVPRRVPGTEGAYNPQFSPDGKWIAFQQGGAGPAPIMKVSTAGGAPVTIIDTSGRFAWGPEGTIVFSKGIQQRGSGSGTRMRLVLQRESCPPSIRVTTRTHLPHTCPMGRASSLPSSSRLQLAWSWRLCGWPTGRSSALGLAGERRSTRTAFCSSRAVTAR